MGCARHVELLSSYVSKEDSTSSAAHRHPT
jgi:hypothetical protein